MPELLALLLASTASPRLEQHAPLLPWERSTLFEHQLSLLEETPAATILTVLGHGANELLPLTVFRPRVRNVVDPRYVRGYANAVRVGLHALQPTEGQPVLLLPVECLVDSAYLSDFVARGVRELEQGTTVVVPKKRDESTFPALLGEHGVSVCSALRAPVGSLRSVVEPLRPLVELDGLAGKQGPVIRTIRDYEEGQAMFVPAIT